MITEHRKGLVLDFSEVVKTVIFDSKSWYKKILLLAWNTMCTDYWNNYCVFFYPKIWWKDYIYGAFLSNSWYSRTLEICFLVQRITLIWADFLGFCFEVRKVVKVPTQPCLKLIRIMLETSNLQPKYTHISSFIKYSF